MTPGLRNTKWIVQRLMAMSPSEIIVRFRRGVWKNLRKIKTPNYKPKLIKSPYPKDPLIIKRDLICPVEIDKLLKEADDYLNHQWKFFGLKDCYETTIDWHNDPQNKISAPRKFGFALNHRDENLVGDIKNTWEKNRHHHLTVLSLAYQLTKKEDYAKEVKDQIFSWIEQNPYLIGVNWTHPLEQAIRLISWVFCEEFLRESIYYNELFGENSLVWKSVYQHQKFIQKTYSVGSSANNHLLGEMAGLYVSSIAWPYFKESGKWTDLAKGILEKEISRQTYKSGINKELAFSYQIFVLEFFLLCVHFSKSQQSKFSDDFINLTTQMANALSHLVNCGENLPNYGDGDEGMAVQLQSTHANRVNWILEISNSLLSKKINPKKSNTLPAVLLGYHSIAQENGDVSSESIGFEDAGIYILRSTGIDGRLKFECLADVGPLGYGSMAAHGHADSLHYTLSVNGVPFIIDPGTYCYHTNQEWREYFKGTLAHNTININGQNQSISAGSFLWKTKANTELLSCDLKRNKLKGVHFGYKQMGVSHNREFTLKNNKFSIVDSLTINKPIILENRIHLDPEVVVEKKNYGYQLHKRGVILDLIIPKDYEDFIVLEGANDGGWYSPVFNVKLPTKTLCFRKTTDKDFSSIIRFEIKNTKK